MTDFRLRPHPQFAGVPGPVLTVVMDGVGIGRHDEGDAVHLAHTPVLDALAASPLTTTLRAHGLSVGLPSDDDMGNSEVGHNALGAGRVFDQGAKRVQQAIASGELFEGPVWRELTERVRSTGQALHFVGLLSDGNVHSHQDHLVAMLKRCHADGVTQVRVHVLLDGPGAECELDGAYVAGGRDKLDHHTLVEHRSPHCTSRQNYRGVLDDKALGVFDGIVIVHRDAQKTEAHQENRNLLLSASATVHTKPHLEIDADDVICTHGATVGSLDEDQLFYLRARGLDEATARAILTYAFVRSVVDDIGLQSLRDRLARALLHRMPEGEALEEMTA